MSIDGDRGQFLCSSGAPCAYCLNHGLKRIERIAQIKKRGSHRVVESVGVGSPNPLGAGLWL